MKVKEIQFNIFQSKNSLSRVFLAWIIDTSETLKLIKSDCNSLATEKIKHHFVNRAKGLGNMVDALLEDLLVKEKQLRVGLKEGEE